VLYQLQEIPNSKKQNPNKSQNPISPKEFLGQTYKLFDAE